MTSASSRPPWSRQPIEDIVSRELLLNPDIADGHSAYARMIESCRGQKTADDLTTAMLKHAARRYQAECAVSVRCSVINDGVADFLFDERLERTVLLVGPRREPASVLKTSSYHSHFPSAGVGRDKGHLLPRSAGGREGGPNYFSQMRSLNQGHSDNGRLWRAIETWLAQNADQPVYIRLVYALQNMSQAPDWLEYIIMPGNGQYRVARFPN